jgi:hypothetical protein
MVFVIIVRPSMKPGWYVGDGLLATSRPAVAAATPDPRAADGLNRTDDTRI